MSRGTLIPFRRQRKSESSGYTSNGYKSRSLISSPTVGTVPAANVFQLVAAENPYGFHLLENLARDMLCATRAKNS